MVPDAVGTVNLIKKIWGGGTGFSPDDLLYSIPEQGTSGEVFRSGRDMFQNPAGFIQEKLSKKVFSANTVRDAMMASFLIVFQKQAESTGQLINEPGRWRETKAGELRKVASAAFAALAAPFEYPTLSQMEQARAEIERHYQWDQLDPALRQEHEQTCRSLFSKFEE
jgi:hypothetical protein